MPKVYNRLQSSFLSLAWPWSGRSLPKRNQWECWDPGLGPNVVGLPGHLPPNMWPTQSLTSWYLVTWLVGWPIAAGKLDGWLTAYDTKYQPDPPCHHISDQPKAWQVDILSHGWLSGQLQLAGWLTAYWTKCQPDPPPGRDMLWPCVWLLWPQRPVVRCTTPHRGI